MQLKPFLLDAWLDQYEHDIEFNLAASTGPAWTVNDILALADDETRHRFLNHNLVYSRPAGADSLREAIAEMQRVPVEAVQVMTGASEALVALMWLAAEPGANVILPLPGFTTFSALPESLGLETRFYRVRRENGFRIDPDEIKRLADSKTKLILINSPHNPTGATIGDGEMEALHDFTAERGIQLVSDEVYHPIYHGRQTKSAARLPHATVISDLSKAFSIPGVRTGWMIEHDAQRREPRHGDDADDQCEHHYRDDDRLGHLSAHGEAAHDLLIFSTLGDRGHVGALPRRVEDRGDVVRLSVARRVGPTRTRTLLSCHVPRLPVRVEMFVCRLVDQLVLVHQTSHRPVLGVRARGRDPLGGLVGEARQHRGLREVLDAHAETTGQVDAGLDRHHVPDLQRLLARQA